MFSFLPQFRHSLIDTSRMLGIDQKPSRVRLPLLRDFIPKNHLLRHAATFGIMNESGENRGVYPPIPRLELRGNEAQGSKRQPAPGKQAMEETRRWRHQEHPALSLPARSLQTILKSREFRPFRGKQGPSFSELRKSMDQPYGLRMAPVGKGPLEQPCLCHDHGNFLLSFLVIIPHSKPLFLGRVSMGLRCLRTRVRPRGAVIPLILNL